MIKNRQRFLLPALIAAGSFLCLMTVILFTNPLDNLSYTIIFFLSLLVLLISFGHVLLYIRSESISTKSRSIIYIVSFIIVIILMLGSAQSLNLTDLAILLLLSWGLVFYSSKRSS
jgi:hypothetical protein